MASKDKCLFRRKHNQCRMYQMYVPVCLGLFSATVALDNEGHCSGTRVVRTRSNLSEGMMSLNNFI